jgi:hypothetical protein
MIPIFFFWVSGIDAKPNRKEYSFARQVLQDPKPRTIWRCNMPFSTIVIERVRAVANIRGI